MFRKPPYETTILPAAPPVRLAALSLGLGGGFALPLLAGKFRHNIMD
jgi:hypothetical protein